MSGLLQCRSSLIHGTGAFAATPISAGTCVTEYVGEKISKEESMRRCETNNEYIFALDEEHDLDGNVSWNDARFINHSCDPNCEAELRGGRIWIMSLRNIDRGEELTLNYGYDLEDYRQHPCRCGAENCVGYIVGEAFFAAVRRRESY